MSSSSNKSEVINSEDKVLRPASSGSNAALIYGIIFVPLMLIMDKDITVDTLAIPAVFLFLIVTLIQFLITKMKKVTISEYIPFGSSVVSVLTAVTIAICLN